MERRASRPKGLQHPWRVLAPLILWGSSLGFDGMSRFASEPRLALVAWVPLALGTALGVSAAALELHSLLRMKSGDPSQRSAFWVLIAEVTALGLFSASLLVRLRGMDAGLAVELSMYGFLTAMLTGFSRDLLGLRTARPAPEIRRRPLWSRGLEEPLPPEL